MKFHTIQPVGRRNTAECAAAKRRRRLRLGILATAACGVGLGALVIPRGDKPEATCPIRVYEDQSWSPIGWDPVLGFPPADCTIVIQQG
jgi:hypothetical protein